MPGDGEAYPEEVYRPREFGDVAWLGGAFREGRIVDVVLDGADHRLVQRVIDFASGMVFVGGGAMSKLGPRRFRLVPPPPPPPPEIIEIEATRLPSLSDNPAGTRIVVPPASR